MLLFAEVGGVVGQAAAGSMWNNVLPRKLEQQGLNSTVIAQVLGSYTFARTYPADIRSKLIVAYGQAMHDMLIPAIVFACVSFIAAFGVKSEWPSAVRWMSGRVLMSFGRLPVDGGAECG